MNWKTKRGIKWGFYLQTTISLVGYLWIAFAQWDIFWVRQLPQWDPVNRGLAFFFDLVLIIMVYGGCITFSEENP